MAGGGWGSIAASNDNFMPDSDAIIGETSSMVVEKFELTGRVNPVRRPADEQTLSDTSCETLENGDLDCRFTKILADDGEIEILAAGTNTFVWAHGGGSLAYHQSNRGSLDLDLSTCDASAANLTSVSSSAIKVHGMLMIAAWAYLAPLGVIFARLKALALRNGFFKTWLYTHMLVQITALACTAGGFAKAYDAIEDAYRYPKLGVGVMMAGIAQLIMGVLRGVAPPPSASRQHHWVGLACGQQGRGWSTPPLLACGQQGGWVGLMGGSSTPGCFERTRLIRFKPTEPTDPA